MRLRYGVLAMLACSIVLLGQQKIPQGVVLPLMVTRGVTLATARPGQEIRARVMQDVPLEGGLIVRAGTAVTGTITGIATRPSGKGKMITFSLDHLRGSQGAVPITTDLRAMASLVEVKDAQIPKTGADRGTPASAWTTVQVGGDVVYRGGGSVMKGLDRVGDPVNNGVLGRVDPNGTCRGKIGQAPDEQALWIFSSDACGAYGFSDLTIIHAGRTDPLGQITIDTADNLRSGSAMLIRVVR